MYVDDGEGTVTGDVANRDDMANDDDGMQGFHRTDHPILASVILGLNITRVYTPIRVNQVVWPKNWFDPVHEDLVDTTIFRLKPRNGIEVFEKGV